MVPGYGSVEPAGGRSLPGHEPTVPVLLLCADGQLLVQRDLRDPRPLASAILRRSRLL